MAEPLSGQYVQVGIFNQLVPDEGPKSIRARCDFTSVDEYIVDLTEAMAKKVIRSVQSLYIDNFDNPNDLTITTEASNQRIIFPANAQGYIPVLLPVPAIFNVAAPSGISIIHMLNVPMPMAIWAP